MSGALFTLDVIVFVILIYWAYFRATRPGSDGEGVFGVKIDLQPHKDARRSGPHWKSAAPERSRALTRTAGAKPPPPWRTQPHRKRTPPRR